MTIEGLERFEDVDSGDGAIDTVDGLIPSGDRRGNPKEGSTEEKKEVAEVAEESLFDKKIIKDVFEKAGLVVGGENSLEEYVGALARVIDKSIVSDDYPRFLADVGVTLQSQGHSVSSPIQAEDIAPLLWEEMGKKIT